MAAPELGVVTALGKKVSELTVDDIARSCERAGVTLDSLCTKGVEFLNAKKESYDIMENKMMVEPLYNVQLKAWFGFLELLKLVSKEQSIGVVAVSHQMADGDVARLEAIASELKGLEGRLSQDSTQQGLSGNGGAVLDVTDAVVR